MSNPIRRSTFRAVVVALLGAVLAATAVLTATVPPAGAASGNPPWEPDANSVGGLVFYNATGQQVTGGNLTDSPVAAYVEGTATIRSGDTKATLYGYSPVALTAPGTWNGEALGSSTTYPNASAPVPLNTSTLPVQTGASGDEDIATLMSDLPNNNASGSGYENLYQLRLKTTQAGQQPNVKYDSADISINSTAGTWSVVYPAITSTATTTALTASPTSPQASGTSVTLTATVTPAAPGTVQFENGTTAIGSPQTVNASTGVATLATSALPVGALTLHAVYTPAPFSIYTGSTGTTSFTVYTPVSTTTTLTASPASPQVSGTSVTLRAALNPTAATGTVQFQNGTTDLGSPVAVSAGVATYTTTTLPVGTLTLHAVYVPSSGSVYVTSTGTTSYTITSSATPTTTVLTVAPGSPQPFGTSETLTATVSPTATGTVQFQSGTTDLGSPVAVSAGVATYATSSLPVGVLTLNAVFTPTTGNGFSGSSGSAPFTVTAIATTTTLTVAPVSPQPVGTSETLTATVSPTATGTVQFQNGTTDLGAPVAVSAGVATSTTAALPVGSLTLNAVFAPTAGTGYAGSTGTADFTVDPLTATTTVLTVAPVSPQTFGTSETLTATISPTATGTVQFQNGTTDLGSPVDVSAGVATYTTSALPVGSLTLHAVFVPTVGNGFAGSTGQASFTVTPIATTTTLTVAPGSPQLLGTSETLTATVSPTATGSVQFQDGTTDLGSPVAVSAGVAHFTTAALPAGTLTLHAVFTPTAGNGYAGSTGTATFTVTPLTATTTSLTVAPTGPQLVGTSETLTATVSPTATGTVQFEVDSTPIGAPVTVTAGVATYTTTALPPGALTLGAVFTPTAGNGYAGSTGTAPFTVTGASGTASTPDGKGYWLVASDGGVFAYGNAHFYGSTGGQHLNAPIVAFATTPDGKGYWLVAADGGVFAYGDATFYGSTGGQHLNAPIVGISTTPDGKGYRLVASDGGVFSYGDATFYGSTGGQHLNAPIVGISTTPDGLGYWLVASDGGVFSYGDATFYGSTGGQHLNAPIVGIATTPDGKGYRLVASDGGVFSYGDATFYGSTGGQHLNAPIVSIATTPDGQGYWLFAADGGVFNYGDAGFYGSAAGLPLTKPII
jgi:hypothetical protein